MNTKDQTLDACRLIEVGMLEAPTFSGYGFLRAAMSPAHNMMVEALDPMRSEGLYSQDINGKPQVKINYQFERTLTPQTTFACTVDTKAQHSSTLFTIDKFLMGGLGFKAKEYSALCEGVDEYFSSVFNNISTGIGSMPTSALSKFRAWGDFRRQFDLTFRTKFLNYIEDYVIGKLAGGYNPLRASAAQQTVRLKDAAGHYVEDVLAEIISLRLKTGYEGRYIMIGGIVPSLWFGGQCQMPNIHCCSELGTDFSKVRNSLPVEFYYSNQIDALEGAGSFILIEEGAVAFLQFNENQFNPTTSNIDTYGNMSISMAAGCDSNFSLNLETFSIEKGMCATSGVPETQVFWKKKWDVWTRPFNFKGFGTAPLSGDIGIYHYKFI